MKSPAFSTRALLSCLMVTGFAVVGLSGIFLYAAPRGPAPGWLVFQLSKHGWQELHIVFGLLFVVAALWHLALNIKPLLSYLRRKATSDAQKTARLWLRPEPLLALIITVFLFVATLDAWPPASTLLQLRSAVVAAFL